MDLSNIPKTEMDNLWLLCHMTSPFPLRWTGSLWMAGQTGQVYITVEADDNFFF